MSSAGLELGDAQDEIQHAQLNNAINAGYLNPVACPSLGRNEEVDGIEAHAQALHCPMRPELSPSSLPDVLAAGLGDRAAGTEAEVSAEGNPSIADEAPAPDAARHRVPVEWLQKARSSYLTAEELAPCKT